MSIPAAPRLDRLNQAGARVLVPGGYGYLGSELCRLLAEVGIAYRSVDLREKDDPHHVVLDLCDARATADCLAEFAPHLLIHCGTRSAGAYKGDFYESYKLDSAALCNIMDSLAELESCRMVYFSSSYVYSGLDPKGRYDEGAVLHPDHNFGVAKAFFEQLILRSHPSSVVFRMSSVFGTGNSLNPNAIIQMAGECREGRDVVVWGRGQRMMQYVYMDDVLGSVFAAAEIEPGLYNLCSDDYMSVAEAAEAIAAFFGRRVEYLHEKPEGETLPFMVNARLTDQLGQEFTPVSDALTIYLERVAG